MKNDTQNQNDNPSLNIDLLMDEIERLSQETSRISRKKVDEIFRFMRTELPNSQQVITASLANILLTDSPHAATDTTLNTIVIHLVKILSNPSQTSALAEALQVYFHARKITEKEYAAEIANEVLENNPLAAFPENSRPGLQDLSFTVMEKIINEKQSRKTQGYKPHSILELVNPYLHYKLANPEIERLKTTMQPVFRNWMTNIGQEGYEKINHEKKFAMVQQEKEAAFSEFKKYLASKAPNKATLVKFIDKIRHSQIDRNEKHAALSSHLDTFLTTKSILAKSALEFRARFHQKLRKLFNLSDQNPDIFRSEEAMLAAHEEAFRNVDNDVTSIDKIIFNITEVEKIYAKNFLNSVLGKSNLAMINSLVLDTLLGPLVSRRDIASGTMQVQREGGYPQKNLVEIYDTITHQLQTAHDLIKGAFSSTLKQQLQQCVHNLEIIKQDLVIYPDAITVVTKPTLVATPAHEPAVVEKITPVIEQPKIKLVENSDSTIESSYVPKRSAKLSDNLDVKIIPSLLKDEFKTDERLEFTAPAPTDTKSYTPEENVTFADPQVEKADKQSEEPLILEESKVAAIDPPPLQIDDSFAFEEPVVTPKPLQIDESFSFEEPFSRPKPLLDTEEDFILEPAQTPRPATDPGILIMTNYRLGEFEQPVLAAWQTMTAASQKEAINNNIDLAILAGENEVRFYVICDLAQQIAAIEESKLNLEQKDILQSTKTVFLVALSNPVDENNWSFFEGTHRDDIDRAISMLQT
jgi:hypothetical protein